MPATASASIDQRAGRLVRPARLSLWVLIVSACTGFSPAAAAQAGVTAPSAQVLSAPISGETVASFYAARGDHPLWMDATSGDAARILFEYLISAEADGLSPKNYKVDQLAKAMRSAWGGSPDHVRKADRMLSEAFVAYVRDLRRTPAVGIHWVDEELKPLAPSPRRLLDAAAAASSVEQWVADMRWMHPIYAGLRQALTSGRANSDERTVLRLNLERARALPASGRHILVNPTAARLTMYEDGEIVDSMRVVVGKPKNPTPTMAALIRYTAVNPYWYVPPDLAAERIAPNVLKQGLSYLRAQGYQAMANWHDEATIIDPETVDWLAVADGSTKVWIRQRPGPANAMGKMKFMFPNELGIYLHDTPQKDLLSEPARMFSGGCVRLEDAPRLARWIYGEPLNVTSRQPELKIDLPQPLPVFITYLTMMPSGTELATLPDVYGRDREELAMLGRTLIAGN